MLALHVTWSVQTLQLSYGPVPRSSPAQCPVRQGLCFVGVWFVHSCMCIFESVHVDGGVGVRAFEYSLAVICEL